MKLGKETIVWYVIGRVVEIWSAYRNQKNKLLNWRAIFFQVGSTSQDEEPTEAEAGSQGDAQSLGMEKNQSNGHWIDELLEHAKGNNIQNTYSFAFVFEHKIKTFSIFIFNEWYSKINEYFVTGNIQDSKNKSRGEKENREGAR